MRSAGLLLATLALVGCNQISGVDELAFDLGGAPAVGGALPSGAGGQIGVGGRGGAGGEIIDCGPCDEPPGPCFEPTGVCVEGACSYPFLDEGVACSDDDPCTEGDACDGQGSCVPGPECPNADPCLDVSCEATGCVEAVKPDGSSCGMLGADRCCGGLCVDVSTDPDHCGGCGYACANGETCESVAATNQCSSSPADTSGRCTCGGTADCPVGQICRNQTPHAWRCTPEGPGDCPGTTFVDVSFCPNYCTY